MKARAVAEFFRAVILSAALMVLADFCYGQEVNSRVGALLKDGSIYGAKIEAKADGSLTFAIMSDIHISIGAPSEKGTMECVEDINNNPDIQFVVITGDIANFGSDAEIASAKRIFDKLNKPWFIIPGNHDATWSESGTNSFAKIFGYERFEFEAGGIKFIGTPCGPNIRMAPALVPRESMIWLKEQIEQMADTQPLFYLNHYPLDTSLLKYNEVLDAIKRKNIQLVISGHWHTDRAMEYEGVPGVIVRSTLATPKGEKGYVIADVKGSTVTFRDKIVGAPKVGNIWFTLRMSNGAPYPKDIEHKPVISNANSRYSNVKELWRYENSADTGAGAAIYRAGGMVEAAEGFNALPSVAGSVKSGDIVLFADEAGVIRALDGLTGSTLWSYKTDGKIFSTPAVSGDYVVVGSSDNNIYCLNPRTGALRWRYECKKSVLGAANIYKGVVYIGASDGSFRALNLKNGSLKWEYKGLKDFVVARPYVDRQQVVIGDWGNTLYSLSPQSGHLQWKWETPNKSNRNLSPAQVWPVKSKGLICIVSPDRFSYLLDAKTGKQLARIYGGREAIGLSPDRESYYIKSMKDTVRSYSLDKILSRLNADNGAKSLELAPADVIDWQSITNYKYEIAPSPITVISSGGKNNKGVLFIPTDKGNIFALNAVDGSLLWEHNLSGALINYILPIGSNQLLVSTMDGVVSLLEY